jgi:guanine deaminase
MCLGAIYWARLDALYFAATRNDAATAGFDDAFVYGEFGRNLAERSLKTLHCPSEEAQQVLLDWKNIPDKIPY